MWGKYRRGQHLSIAVPPEVKSQLIHRKALGQVGIGAQIVEAFTDAGVRLSEATFRKWVQLGLLPRSRRVGRKGKHQGSLGLYPDNPWSQEGLASRNAR